MSWQAMNSLVRVGLARWVTRVPDGNVHSITCGYTMQLSADPGVPATGVATVAPSQLTGGVAPRFSTLSVGSSAAATVAMLVRSTLMIEILLWPLFAVQSPVAS